MAKKNTEGDSWGELLSNLGIEDTAQEYAAQPEEVQPEKVKTEEVKTLPEPVDAVDFGAEPFDPGAEDADESPTPKEKKSIFSRFPKISFFGAPPEVSLDSVIEGTRSPTLGGKTFTDNTLEKMPVSQERKNRRAKDRQEEQEPDAWSTVASQIGTLASGTDVEAKPTTRQSRRAVSSMFDDPIPEPEEVRALKDLMGEPPYRDRTHRGAPHEEESDFRGRGRRQQRESPLEERGVRGRGSRHRSPVEVDDLPESNFEMMDEAAPTTRGVTRDRGRRGSRYPGDDYRSREPIQDDVSQEEWSEVDAALQAGRDGLAPRGGRHQRYDKRQKPEQRDGQTIGREPLDREDSGVVAYHGDVPSWDEAISDIISGNIARHRAGHASGGHTGRGRSRERR